MGVVVLNDMYWRKFEEGELSHFIGADTCMEIKGLKHLMCEHEVEIIDTK